MASAISPQLVSGVNGGNAASAAGNRGTAQELRDNFMTMLVTQLRNQDPMNPLENNELTSQLAQINTVSGIDALNDIVGDVISQVEAGQSLQAAALIGKGVLVPGDRLLVGEEGVATPFGVELEQPASALRAKIVGSDGQVVHSLDLGSTDAGVQIFTWDGKLENGESAPAGAYQVTFEAVGEDGEVVANIALNYAVVSGVSTGDDGPRLDLGGISEQVGLPDVRQIL